ncbi:MAG: hypothetical protein HYW22_02050 [Candidatus Aenigmarchaeota archaeon]|nr:hypothetical protein [Candidatus Aenigmarchaeota archaeon]
MNMECKICKSPIFEGQVRGPCPKCDVNTCVYCSRMCDVCLRNFCFEHVKLAKSIVPGGMQLMKLCDFCKPAWKA